MLSHAEALVRGDVFNPGMFITVFADASFCPDTKAWGYGWWIKFGDPVQTREGHGGGLGMESSLLAEVGALRAALEWVKTELLPADLKDKRLVIQSDCTGALAAIQTELKHLRRDHGLASAYSKHVKGHQGHSTPRNSINTKCDRHARRVMKQYRQQQLQQV